MIATPIKMTKASTVRRPHDASINARSALPADDEAPPDGGSIHDRCKAVFGQPLP